MKRFSLLALLTLALGLLSTSAWSAPHGYATEGQVTTSGLNVRSGPSTRYPTLGVLRRGDRVQILAQESGWYRVANARISGWAHSAYVDTYRSPPQAVYVEPHRRQGGHEYRQRPRFAFIGANRFGFANVFDGPGRRHVVIGRLAAGERVRVLDIGPRWTLIRKRGLGQGYVRTGFLHGI